VNKGMDNMTYLWEMKDYCCIITCFFFTGKYEYQVKVVEKNQDTQFFICFADRASQYNLSN
jgi:hypothetical protein